MPSTTHWVISVVLHFALWLSYFKCTPLQISIRDAAIEGHESAHPYMKVSPIDVLLEKEGSNMIWDIGQLFKYCVNLQLPRTPAHYSAVIYCKMDSTLKLLLQES